MDGTDIAITVEYDHPGGANPGDVQRTALIEGVVRAGTVDTINSVPRTPAIVICVSYVCV
eukprot:COSAG02_NODE_1330_length_13218_cov_8.247504_14_plen_60_part_00